ncbi:MAG: hypothetical protein JWM87_2878 [Candidatus Eremiobacteraeota bacterium]|nr:hypothetical protein [Candidatus Eremiobacteraeota bacterium]
MNARETSAKALASALALGLLGVANLPAPFVASFAPGETLNYRYAVIVTGPSVHQTYRGQLSLAIKTVEPKVTGTEVRVLTVPAQRSARSFELTPSGSVVFAGSAEAAHNYFSFDARQYCDPPPSVSTGMSWSCKVPSAGTFHGGDARVRVASNDSTGTMLEIDGTAVDAPETEHDPDTGRTFMKRSSVIWHETVRFKGGLVQSMSRRQTTRAVMENLTIDTTITTNIDRA